MEKNKIIIGAAVVVVLLGGWWLMKGDGEVNDENNGIPAVVEQTPRAGEIAVEGKLGCMPLKSGATPSADECVIGLVGDDDKFYALDTSKVEEVEKGIDLDTDVKVIGAFTPVDASSDEVGIYKYDGVLAVRVLVNND